MTTKRKKTETDTKNVHPFPGAKNAKTKESALESEETLSQLGEELDKFHADPSKFDFKQIESIVKEFASLFKKQMKKNLAGEDGTLIGQLKKIRKAMQANEVDDYGMDRDFEMAIKPFFDFVYSKYFRVTVEGIENIPSEGRCLLVSNHSGVIPIDGAMLKVAIMNDHPAKRELRFLVDDFVFHFPFMGTLMNRIGGVRACPENAERLLNSGEIVSVFPEGIKGISKLFKDRYKLERFGRGGVIRLAMKTKSPITPVAVIGAEEIYPLMFKSHILARPLGLPFIPITPLFPLLGPLGALPLPTKWTIHFGKTISYENATAQDVNDGILINKETESLRQTIQQMVKDGLAKRKSVFGGD